MNMVQLLELVRVNAPPGARSVITVRKARWGWRVNGRWCPTVRSRTREIHRIRDRAGRYLVVRTPG